MPTRNSFDYAVLRVVPRVERQEFLNVGVILFCLEKRFLGARVHIDNRRLAAVWPELDLDIVRQHAEAFVKICRARPRGRADCSPLPARAFPLARRSPQHHHSGLPGSHRAVRRPRNSPRSTLSRPGVELAERSRQTGIASAVPILLNIRRARRCPKSAKLSCGARTLCVPRRDFLDADVFFACPDPSSRRSQPATEVIRRDYRARSQ